MRRGSRYSAAIIFEEEEQTQITLNDADYEFPIETDQPFDPSHLIQTGVLTEEAWQAHLAGQSWQIEVSR